MSIKSIVSNSMPANTKNRMLSQDIGKGIAILAVILCHTMPASEQADIIVRACIGYAMPFFFFMAGFNHKSGRRSAKENIKRRAGQILKPLVVYSVVLGVIFSIISFVSKGKEAGLEMMKCFVGLWTMDPIAGWLHVPTIGQYTGTQRIFEPYWFLLFMFSAMVIFYLVVDYAMENMKRFISVSTGLVAITFVFNVINLKLPWGFHNAPAIAVIMMLGTLTGRSGLLSKPASRPYWTPINTIIAFAMIFTFNMLYPRACQISGSGMMSKVLGPVEVPLTVIYSFIASYFLINVCKLIEKIPYVSKFIAWFGVNSMSILMIHLLLVGAGKVIAGVGMNADLGYVEKMSWKDFLALIIVLILVSLYLLAINGIKQKVAAKKAKKAEANA